MGKGGAGGVIAHAEGGGEDIWFLDVLVTVKLRGDDARNYAMVEYLMPEGSRTPLHRHTDEDETFYVLEGVVTVFLDDGETLTGSRGGVIHIRRGRAHALRADAPSKLLVLSNPRGFVEFAREAGAPAPRHELPPASPPDAARLTEIGRKYNIEILGPPPG